MEDALMHSTDREQALSIAYIAAVAAGAGYTTLSMDLDRDGVDLQVRAGGTMRPSLDIQLKATINLGEPSEGQFRFPLKRRNYDLLRTQTMVPRILVVLHLPKIETDWLSVTPEQLVMRRCAYWANITGSSETKNQESVTVSVPQKNLFHVEGLKALMQQARTGVIA
jgi:hypothetical protein